MVGQNIIIMDTAFDEWLEWRAVVTAVSGEVMTATDSQGGIWTTTDGGAHWRLVRIPV